MVQSFEFRPTEIFLFVFFERHKVINPVRVQTE